jgi:hypothetical protein
VHVRGVVVHGEHDDADVGRTSTNFLDGGKTVHSRQTQVDDRDVGLLLRDDFQRATHIARLADHADIGFGCEHLDNGLPHHVVIVDQIDTY